MPTVTRHAPPVPPPVTYTIVVDQDEAELIATCLSRISDSQGRYRPLYQALRQAGVCYEKSHWHRENSKTHMQVLLFGAE
jgi:hypothetical protein